MDILKDKSSRKFIPEIDEVLTEKWYSPSCWYKVLHPEDKQRVQEVPQERIGDSDRGSVAVPFFIVRRIPYLLSLDGRETLFPVIKLTTPNIRVL